MSLAPYARPTDGLRDYYQRPIAEPPKGVPVLAVLLLGFLFGLAVGVTVATAAMPCVTMTVRPLFMLPMTRADLRAELRIVRHADHRLYALSWTSDEGSAGSSQRTLEGEDAPVTHTHWLKSQPAANYVFTVAVYDGHGKVVGRDRGEIRSAGDGGPFALFTRPGGVR